MKKKKVLFVPFWGRFSIFFGGGGGGREREREGNNGTPRDILGMRYSQIGAVL